MNPNENRKNQFTLVKDAWATSVSDSRIFKINSTWCGGYHALQILAVTKTMRISGEKSSLTVCCPWENLVVSFMSSKQQPLKLNDIFYGHVIPFGAARAWSPGGWFLSKIWRAPFKVQNTWMFSMRNPRLVKTKVIRVLTGEKTSWTISFFLNDSSY